jgi:hypothetical protein
MMSGDYSVSTSKNEHLTKYPIVQIRQTLNIAVSFKITSVQLKTSSSWLWQHRKLNWLDKDSDKDQSQFDELFNWTHVSLNRDRILDLTLFNDEARFHQPGCMNSQKFRIWVAVLSIKQCWRRFFKRSKEEVIKCLKHNGETFPSFSLKTINLFLYYTYTFRYFLTGF